LAAQQAARSTSTEQRGSGGLASGAGAKAAGERSVIADQIIGNVYVGAPPQDTAQALTIYRQVYAATTRQLPLRGFRPEGDEIVVDGGKTFITNGDVADLILLFGKWSGIDGDRSSISALILEQGAPGLKVVRTEDKMGIRASGTATLAFDGCRVPRANLLGKPGDGLPLLLASLNKSRPSVAAHALGIARAAFEDAVAYINERRQSGRRIIEFQGIQFLLADLASELAQCEAWLWHVARLIDGGAEDIGIEASMLKLRASDLAMRIATEAVQLHGGYGYCKDYRVERLMRDAKITQIWEGTNQIHRQLIGRSFIDRGKHG
jgi:acyl-CoA dehydrogenase